MFLTRSKATAALLPVAVVGGVSCLPAQAQAASTAAAALASQAVAGILIAGTLLFGLAMMVLWLMRRVWHDEYASPQTDPFDTPLMVAEPPDFPSEPMTLVPRTLKGDIFSPVHAHLTLENKIELAAEASLRHSRTIGLVVLQIPAFAEIAARHGRHVADKLIGTVAMELCSSVRRGDHVAVRDNGEIIVCVTLVAVRDELSRIAARLLTVIHGLGSASEPSFTAEAGLSIYPLDGYSGEELIESARTNCLRALTRRTPEFFEIQPPEMQPPVRKRSASVPAGARKPRKKQAAPPTASIN